MDIRTHLELSLSADKHRTFPTRVRRLFETGEVVHCATNREDAQEVEIGRKPVLGGWWWWWFTLTRGAPRDDNDATGTVVGDDGAAA